MRTTITLADDVAAVVDKLQHERGIGVSAVVNDLIRNGLSARRSTQRFEQTTHDLGDLGSGVDLSNIADVIETLDGPAAR